MLLIRTTLACGLCLLACRVAPGADPRWVVYDGFTGAGKGQHVVLVSGDEEYRSEECLPQLGKILAKHHGFRCTVLFAQDKDGTINPKASSNIPGTEALNSADLLIIFTRFRNLPDEQMKPIADYIAAGKPVIGLRTATHAFSIPAGRTYAKWSYNNKDWDGGFGRQILGETWIDHHGGHNKQSTRGIILEGQESHPILRGIEKNSIWGATDVYAVRLPLPVGCQPILLGAVLEGMQPDDKPVAGKKNDPMLPVAWTKTYQGESGLAGRVFTTTMGSSQDLTAEGTRRMLVNAAYWCLGLEDKIPDKSEVGIVGEYHPLPFKADGAKPGVKPADHEMITK